VKQWLDTLCVQGDIVEDSGIYYHAKLYDRARKATIRSLREQAVTRPPEHYAALMAERAVINASAKEQLKQTIELFAGDSFLAAAWENIILSRRVRGYSGMMLDRLLAEGEFFWKMAADGTLTFYRYEDVDWDSPLLEADMHAEAEDIFVTEEQKVYQELQRRGASFLNSLTKIPVTEEVRELLMNLAAKGKVCADSFVPVRQWLNKDKIKKATARQRVNVRVAALSAGRWDVVHPLQKIRMEEMLEVFLAENIILCRETFRRSVLLRKDLAAEDSLTWSQALEFLRIWEFTGQVRRGYFVRGLSGAQFIRKQDYEGIIHALAQPEDRIIWLNAADPAQIWGKVLEHVEDYSFMNVPGTVVALRAGRPVVVLERQGKILNVLEETDLEAVMKEFVCAFQDKCIFPEKRRLLIKEYPKESGEALKIRGLVGR